MRPARTTASASSPFTWKIGIGSRLARSDENRPEYASLGIRGEAEQVVDDDVDGAANRVAAQIGKVQRLRGDSLPREGRVAMHQDGQYLGLAVAAQSRLLGARTAQRDGIDGLQMAGIRDQVNPYRPPTCAGVHAGRADVILHVAAAQHAARIDILESGKHFGRRDGSRC